MKKILNKLPVINDFFVVLSSPVEVDDSYATNELDEYQSAEDTNYQKIYLFIIKSKLFNTYSDIKKEKDDFLNLIFNNISKTSN